MYLNFCKYHVQDRDYTRAEVASLINNDTFKHHILSNGQHFYSLGSTAETLAVPLGIAAAAVVIVSAIAVTALAASNIEEDNESCSSSNNHTTTNNYYIGGAYYNNNNRYNSGFKVTDIKDDHYSGREVTKFLNEYYDYNLFQFNKSAHYGNIIDNLINHKYAEADIPTNYNSNFFSWDAAVLDTDYLMS
ncbi:hypothetical protein [Rickettsiales endosymbiont of Stachyamoeba lipophora]|uniref:hypothetical protein n=1 Tax=Rickettsiales endosymbiont of Stachyamoeba lipophora TaxID=2486578 RepID=UPI000F6489D6|nr:hypothetical protein [Rickettsiales endosymbiont of Stachyamoeba lipophora]AZL16397.1 hypothetical protein EF513_07660 [Rickettsiales endosymbiont of Stachyamoeba lipophora]